MAALDDVQVKDGVEQDTVDAVAALSGNYKYGWETEIEMEYAPKGVNPDIVRLISSKNNEPEWMTEWRLQAFARWENIEEPTWAMVNYPDIDFQDIYYYARPKSMEEKPKSLDDVDPKLRISGSMRRTRGSLSARLEIPKLHSARRRQPGRVLFDCDRQQPPAGGYRHEDGAFGCCDFARRVRGLSHASDVLFSVCGHVPAAFSP